MQNADTAGRGLIENLREFAARHANAHLFPSVGQLRYLSCIAHMDGLVGNSSSGLIEAPSFRKGTVNIGDRQAGRLRAASVIDCEPDRREIGRAIEQLYSPAFAETLKAVVNPYGDGGASERIVRVLQEYSLASIVKKRFFDLSPAGGWP